MRLEELSKVIHTLASHSFKRGRIAFPTTYDDNRCKIRPLHLICELEVGTHPMHLLSLQKPNINLLPPFRKTERAALDRLVDKSRCSMVVEDEDRLQSRPSA
jgi:hypothetical protein